MTAVSPADRYVVAGNPVAHSRSPSIHAQFAALTGQAVEYGQLLCPLEPPGAFEATVRGFAASAMARGCNVTVPFKFEAFRLATRCTERAALAQAANVLCFDGHAAAAPAGWLADNTDGAGLVRDIEHNATFALAGQRVLLIGAGGAAAGALGPLIAARPACVAVANRTLERAAMLVARHQAYAALHGVQLDALPLSSPGTAWDVVINASASSLHAAGVPVDAQVLRPGTLALDMMYGSAASAFLAWAEQHGAMGRDGLGMLVEQAAEAFALWHGVRPPTAGVLAALRQQMTL